MYKQASLKINIFEICSLLKIKNNLPKIVNHLELISLIFEENAPSRT